MVSYALFYARILHLDAVHTNFYCRIAAHIMQALIGKKFAGIYLLTLTRCGTGKANLTPRLKYHHSHSI